MPLAPGSVLLDTMRADAEGRPGGLLFEQPTDIIVANRYDEVTGALEEIDRRSAAGQWCAGYLAYEAGYALQDGGFLDPPKPDGPPVRFGVYERPKRLSPEEIEQMLGEEPESHIGGATFDLSRSEYQAAISTIRRHIREGDVYQINFTAPVRFSLEGSSLGLYRALRRKQRVSYGAVIRVRDDWILSLSPELFVRRRGDRLTARPMKGTAPRAPRADEDIQRAANLQTDEKNRAENVMIVDLIRNDLARVAEAGSVKVPVLFEVERYETLWQMTSTVQARIRSGKGFADVVEALFPCGSITGAPKRRAMQIIRALEAVPRGVYCGAIGYVAPGGDFTLSVPIRTITLQDGNGKMGIGSGVVWDSRADDEFEECLLKARFLTDPPRPPFQLIETMRARDGHIELIDLHRERLDASADYFDRPFDATEFDRKLKNIGNGDLRVRLLLDERGHIEIETSSLESPNISTAAIHPEPLDITHPFHHHKTTRRDFYDDALRWAREHGADEAILLNERGEVAEGTITNVWIETDGRLKTPPPTSGGLAGVFRRHLLETNPRTEEAVLHPHDLLRADRVLLSNAVRGLFEVQIVEV